MTKQIDSFSLTPKWPVGLPDHCEHCGNGYDIRFALEIGPGRLGRFLRKIAPWMTAVTSPESKLLEKQKKSKAKMISPRTAFIKILKSGD